MANAPAHSASAGLHRFTGPTGGLNAGTLEGGRHRLPIRVYYEDTDAGGIVYYANYLKFAERARTEMLRFVGIEQDRLRAETGLSFAVRGCMIDYLAPARLDDALEIVSRLASLGGASVVFAQEAVRGKVALARLTVRLACLSSHGRAIRIPPALRAALEPLSSTS